MQTGHRTARSPKPFEPHFGPGTDPFETLLPSPRGMGRRAGSLSGTVAQRIAAFGARTGNGAWPKLPRANIAQRLAALQSRPDNIRQYNLNACGPAAAMHLHATRDFAAFANMVMTLYDDGKAAFGKIGLRSDDLDGIDPQAFAGNATPGHLLLDWMILASLRKNDSAFFDGTPDDNLSAITTPGEMVHWLKDGVGFAEADAQTNLAFNKDLDHLRGLKVAPDLQPVLLVNSGVLRGKSDKKTKRAEKKSAKSQGIIGKGLAMFPNHWAPLLQPVTDDTKPVRVWSWGGPQDFPSLDTPVWSEGYWGAVVARA